MGMRLAPASHPAEFFMVSERIIRAGTVLVAAMAAAVVEIENEAATRAIDDGRRRLRLRLVLLVLPRSAARTGLSMNSGEERPQKKIMRNVNDAMRWIRFARGGAEVRVGWYVSPSEFRRVESRKIFLRLRDFGFRGIR